MPEFKIIKVTDYKISNRLLLLGLGCLSLLLGLLYYLYLRGAPPSILQHYPVFAESSSPFLNAPSFYNQNSAFIDWLNAVPTFIHVVAFSFITLSIMPLSKRSVLIVLNVWLLINIAFEIGQGLAGIIAPYLAQSKWSIIQLLHHYFISGTFAISDIGAALLGAVFVYAVLDKISCTGLGNVRGDGEVPITPGFSRFARAMLTGVIFAGGIFSISGSYDCSSQANITGSTTSTCDSGDLYSEPVYMSYDELRTVSIFTVQDQPLLKTDKIYLYQNYLLVNSANQGIHIYDNTDPANPQHVIFINIPGNVDIAIKQDYLYVDSYIDLVTIDISDMNTIKEVHRVENMFPYDPYQNIPEGIYFRSIDKEKGVVIGYIQNNYQNKK